MSFYSASVDHGPDLFPLISPSQPSHTQPSVVGVCVAFILHVSTSITQMSWWIFERFLKQYTLYKGLLTRFLWC